MTPRFLKSLFLLLVFFTQTSLAAVTIFQEDWETGLGSWTTDNGIWERNPAPDPWCHGGVYCMGTGWGGDYPVATDSRLISPSVVLPALNPGERHVLRYWQWFDYSPWYNDSGFIQVQVWDPVNQVWLAWQNADPVPINNVSDTETTASRWSRRDVDLSAYAGQTIRIGFYHVVDTNYQSTGWYVDDVSVITLTPTVAPPVSWNFEGLTESDWWGDWSAENGVWQINQDPDSWCHGGERCFGTDYEDNYPNYPIPA